MGVKFVFVLPCSRGKLETHKQRSQEISGKWWDSPDSPGIGPGQSGYFLCFLVYLFVVPAVKFPFAKMMWEIMLHLDRPTCVVPC